MTKCPSCNSDDVLLFGMGDGKTKNYRKIEENGSAMFRSTVCKTWAQHYRPGKYLCCQCGMVYEKLSEDALKELIENRQFEVE